MSVICISAPPLPYFLECGFRTFEPGQEHPNRRNHGLFDLIVVASGTLHLGENRHTWSLSAGQSLILLPDSHHYGVRPCDESTAFYWVHFYTECAWKEMKEKEMIGDPAEHIERFLRYPYMIGLPKLWAFPHPDQTLDLLQQLVKLNTEKKSTAIWQQQRIFETLLHQLDSRQQGQTNGNMMIVAEKVETFIRQHYPEPISASLLSQQFHFHYNYISRCMKRAYGMTPMEYLMHYRLEQAKRRLIYSEQPVAHIAHETGFENPSYFSKCFFQRFGLTPHKFRTAYR